MGKAKAIANGKKRQKGQRSVREVRRDLVPLRELLKTMREQRQLLAIPAPLALSGSSKLPVDREPPS